MDDNSIDDEIWRRMLDCACSQFESYVRQGEIDTPEARRIALGDALQHAVGLLQLLLLTKRQK